MNGDGGPTDSSLPALLAEAKELFQRADYPGTERFARAALALAQAQGDTDAAIGARVWIGAGLTQQGLYAAGLRWLHEALDLAHSHALATHAGRACNYIAVCHEELGDFATAAGWYERGIGLARAAADREVEVYLLSNLADGWVTAGSAARAMPLLDQAIAVARSIGDQAHASWCLSARARLRDAAGDETLARADHATAVEAARTSGSERMLAECLRDEGAFLAHRGDTAGALERLAGALAITTRLDIRREMFRAHEALAAVYEQIGDARLALHHYRQFHLLHAGVFDEVVKAKLENLNAVSELQGARHQEEISRLRNVELASALRQVEDQARELQRLSQQDALTGVFNRRCLETALGEGFAHARQSHQPLCVAMLDVDHFKDINDRHGHAIGDQVLCRLARLVELRLRAGDILARYGGEEFVLVLPNIGAPAMRERAEAIRATIAADDWTSIAPALGVTISIGIATADEAAGSEALVDLADQRMYAAKHAGRNRVCGPD